MDGEELYLGKISLHALSKGKLVHKCYFAQLSWRPLFNLEPMSIPPAHNSVLPGIQLMATGNGDPIAAHFVINIASIPSHRFLDNDNRDAYLDKCVPLNKYALKGNWEAAERILKNDPELLTSSITTGGDTVLHIAAGARHVPFVEKVVELMDEQDLALEDMNGNTAFSIAAAAGSIEIAQIMMKKNKKCWRKPTSNRCFFTCIDNGLYDLAMKMLISNKALAKARDVKQETALHILARMPSEFTSQSPGMWSRLINSFIPGWKFSYHRNLKQVDDALQLVQCLWTEILRSDHDDMMGLIKHPSKLLFNATKLGNYEFLAVLINSYPDLEKFV
ncbi:hypothetical protein ACLB2K_029306 [Fragaria x ananassa]